MPMGVTIYAGGKAIGEQNAGLPIADATTIAPVGAHGDSAVAAALLLTPPAGATKLLIQALGGNVRYRLDGVDPTATVGFQLRDGDAPLLIPLAAGGSVRAIGEAAGARVQYQWSG